MVTDGEEVDSKLVTEEGGHSWLNPIPTLQSLTKVSTCDSLYSLLIEFEELFTEPTTLPLACFLNHTVHLKPNSEAVNVRSYRYSPSKKAK